MFRIVLSTDWGYVAILRKSRDRARNAEDELKYVVSRNERESSEKSKSLECQPELRTQFSLRGRSVEIAVPGITERVPYRLMCRRIVP